MEAEGFSLPVIEARCEYRVSAKYDDDVDVRTSGATVSAVRVRFDYEVVRAADEVVLATGHTVHAVLDRSGRPRRLPERARTVFASTAPDAREAPE